MTTRSQDVPFDPEAESTPTTVESLLHELDSVGQPEARFAPSEADDAVAATLAAALRNLVGDDEFAFDEGMLKQNLEPVLVTLVALQERGTHGKALMSDLAGLFGADLSPGTVYPALHDLDDEELLRVHEMVRTREYRVEDSEAAKTMIAEAMYQHLALGLFFYETLQRM